MTEANNSHASIEAALAAAQAEMGPAIKDTQNPHLKSKYADLASVMAACMPALSKHGIAVIQPPYDDDSGRYVKTIMMHGPSSGRLECRVPLIVQKNDMQGYGSAVTYARRYGLMAMAGIAPDDDDGAAAVLAKPDLADNRGGNQSRQPKNQPPPDQQSHIRISAEQFIRIRDLAEKAVVDLGAIASREGVASAEEISADRFDGIIKKLQATIQRKTPPPDTKPTFDDEIPF